MNTMLNTINYTTTDGQTHTLVFMGQGVAKIADADDIAKDEHGFTNPNLHRRINNQDDKSYTIGIYGLNSYRTTKTVTHNEDSTTTEVP